ncbi:MAG: bifunctional hydroxymethylpyrimidine kinase/phosphomethylpyrimidine kinase [Kiritimatiellae bacterium]|nr:bifunctional hydroxymethylpyrimidine kinase/phosphomethylpyrimidine kinase [Kiritimatiellia bacterium]
MRGSRRWPIALTIGGTDSSGGAGVTADVGVFALAGLHGAVALTCVTAQRPGKVTAVQPLPVRLIRAQLDAVAATGPVAVVKTGMLFAERIIEAVALAVRQHRWQRLVVDPVMVAAGGDPLLQPRAVRAMRERIVPLATIITPNLYEAALLLERPIGPNDDLVLAARELARRFRTAVLLKGGHRGGMQIENAYADGHTAWRLITRRAHGVSDHGAGCLVAALVTAHLAHGRSPSQAARAAIRGAAAAFNAARRVGHWRLADPALAWRR